MVLFIYPLFISNKEDLYEANMAECKLSVIVVIKVLIAISFKFYNKNWELFSKSATLKSVGGWATPTSPPHAPTHTTAPIALHTHTHTHKWAGPGRGWNILQNTKGIYLHFTIPTWLCNYEFSNSILVLSQFLDLAMPLCPLCKRHFFFCQNQNQNSLLVIHQQTFIHQAFMYVDNLFNRPRLNVAHNLNKSTNSESKRCVICRREHQYAPRCVYIFLVNMKICSQYSDGAWRLPILADTACIWSMSLCDTGKKITIIIIIDFIYRG